MATNLFEPTIPDLAIVGGGLAGGLVALAVTRARPALSLVLIEAGDSFGGNHRWSWFEGDLEAEAEALLDCFPLTVWRGGYTVRFPGFARRLPASYRSLASCDFDASLRRLLPQQAIRTGSRAIALDATGVTLESGERIAARAVIDCRDFKPSAYLTGGWQLFAGRHIRTDAPHGLAEPIIMDADLPQHDAYRFVYSLPLFADEVFVEDTYYADTPVLDLAVLGRRVAAYAEARGWTGETVGAEAGLLPVLTGGDFVRHRESQAMHGVALAGARGLFSHPLTSYTLPFAAETALAVARAMPIPGADLAALLDARAAKHWRATRFYRLLGKMLFQAAEAEARWRIFARFYRLPAPLIARFYAGRSTPADMARVLIGRPPVPISRGVAALLGKGAPLVQGSRT
ncbi:lycopene beta-cyclase CrtY [Qipengyuania sediminis]|uniref:lycopene beta-cyclase CrtY n=1 Tax=Qipengyuania sediminis TaxID=1532023 RepID=UPI0010599859|nr:lycopene beta-cyclase CrtY [Qipengyuania sediminis]